LTFPTISEVLPILKVSEGPVGWLFVGFGVFFQGEGFIWDYSAVGGVLYRGEARGRRSGWEDEVVFRRLFCWVLRGKKLIELGGYLF